MWTVAAARGPPPSQAGPRPGDEQTPTPRRPSAGPAPGTWNAGDRREPVRPPPAGRGAPMSTGRRGRNRAVLAISTALIPASKPTRHPSRRSWSLAPTPHHRIEARALSRRPPPHPEPHRGQDLLGRLRVQQRRVPNLQHVLGPVGAGHQREPDAVGDEREQPAVLDEGLSETAAGQHHVAEQTEVPARHRPLSPTDRRAPGSRPPHCRSYERSWVAASRCRSRLRSNHASARLSAR
jgi:hypothetical protein